LRKPISRRLEKRRRGNPPHWRSKLVINIKGYDVLIDDEDVDKVSNYKWCKLKIPKYIYFCRSYKTGTKSKTMLLHRFITNAPKGTIVDHINGNTLDNRKCNLRFCTIVENSRNRKRNMMNISGYKGISFKKRNNKWQAQIEVNQKAIYLGIFNTPEEAYKAYCEASKKYHKEFGRTE
jgi:hypothetical protein